VPKEGEFSAVFTIKANRFLRNMVRAVVGTLLDVGMGKTSIEQFRDIIDAKSRIAAGDSAPADGLYLVRIEYPPFTPVEQKPKRRKRSPFRHMRRRVRKFFRWRLPRALRITRYWIRERIFGLPPLHDLTRQAGTTSPTAPTLQNDNTLQNDSLQQATPGAQR